MTDKHVISRRLEIDAGHRVPDHGSKCRNLHGHRYVIEAICEGPLAEAGEQRGMVLDFGFLKEEMVRLIHDRCDHRFIFAWWDDTCRAMFVRDATTYLDRDDNCSWYRFEDIVAEVKRHGGAPMRVSDWAMADVTPNTALRFYLTDFSPTAENLARHWYTLLYPAVAERSSHRASLVAVRVHETPNCVAEYRP